MQKSSNLNQKRKLQEVELNVERVSLKKYEQYFKKQFRQRNLISEFVFGSGDFLSFEELIIDDNQEIDYDYQTNQKSNQNQSNLQQGSHQIGLNTENIMELDTGLEIDEVNNKLTGLSFSQTQSSKANNLHIITTNQSNYVNKNLLSYEEQDDTSQSNSQVINEENKILKIIDNDIYFESKNETKRSEENDYLDYSDFQNDSFEQIEDYQIEIIDFGEITEQSSKPDIEIEDNHLIQSQQSQNGQMLLKQRTQKVKLIIGENTLNKIKKVLKSSKQIQSGIQKKIRKNKLILVKGDDNKQKLFLIKRK